MYLLDLVCYCMYVVFIIDQNGAEGKENCKKPQKKQPAAKKTAAKKGKTSAAKKPAKAPKGTCMSIIYT